MHGTFNGIQLRRISSRSVTKTERGTTLSSFRVIDGGILLEAQLRLGARALLILSDETIEGRIVHFNANIEHGYEITIESPPAGIPAYERQ